jgi:hypothetical protein
MGYRWTRRPRVGFDEERAPKMMFDARQKIHVHLVAHGYLDAEGGMP